jgi:hypothetical protein
VRMHARGRLLIDKQSHGDLQATSRGQMLTGLTPVQGSAGYVAIERVSGTLQGRTGTFVLQHNGTHDPGHTADDHFRGAGLGHWRAGRAGRADGRIGRPLGEGSGAGR